MNATNTLKKQGIEKTFDYIYKDPDKNMPKIMDWADKFAEGEFPTQREMIREAITDPEHPYYNFICHLPATFTAQDAGQQNMVTNGILLMTRLMTLSVKEKSLVFTYIFTRVENRWFVRKI